MRSIHTLKMHDRKFKNAKTSQIHCKTPILRLFLTASAPYFILSLAMMIAFLALHHFIFDVFFIENA